MTLVIAALGVLILVLGLVGFTAPQRFRAMFAGMTSRQRFIAAIVLRLGGGVLLWLVADELRFPQVMRIIAVIAIAAAVGILVMGQERLDRLVDWWLGMSDSWLRVSTLFAAAFGAFLVYVAV